MRKFPVEWKTRAKGLAGDEQGCLFPFTADVRW